MEKSIAEMRSAIVRYYEDRGYTHEHSETYVPHDADHVLWLYTKIQEGNGNEPTDSQWVKGTCGLLFIQKQVELDRFGQSRLSGRSGLLYNYEDNGGLWENLRFSPLSLLGEDETSVSFVLRTHSTMFHLLHRTTSKSKGVNEMLEPIMPEYDHTMHLKGFSPTQIYSAFKQTQRRKRNDEKKKKREESILEKETMAFIEAMLMATTKEAMKEIFKDFKIK